MPRHSVFYNKLFNFLKMGVGSALTRRAVAWFLVIISGKLTEFARRIRSPFRLDQVATLKDRELLAANLNLKKYGKSQRCFVLASGPSTLKQDLMRLRGHPIIAVNEMFLRLNAEGIPATVLSFTDPSYLRDTPGYAKFRDEFIKTIKNTPAIGVVPIFSKNILGKMVDNYGKLNYFSTIGNILDYGSYRNVPNLDFENVLPGLFTVTHTSIALALYMGFSEVYVLGVDIDYIARPNSPISHGYGLNPYNEHDNIDAVTAYKDEMNWDYPALLVQTADQLRAYEWLDKISRKNGQRIYNANPEGLLEAFERRSYDELHL